jgi:ribosome biogenesis GTPase
VPELTGSSRYRDISARDRAQPYSEVKGTVNKKPKRSETDPIAKLSNDERRRLFRQAWKLRKAVADRERRSGLDAGRTRNRSNRWDEEDSNDPSYVKMRRRTGAPLELLARRLLKEEGGAPAEGDGALADTTAQRMTVLTSGSGTCEVWNGSEVVSCVIPGSFANVHGSGLVAGDRVAIGSDGAGSWVVRSVEPRTTVLSRPNPHVGQRERVIVANVDTVVIVVAVVAPPLHERLIDRMLIAIQKGRAAPVICVNKIDLLEEREAAEREATKQKLAPYVAAGIPVFEASAMTGAGIEPLRGAIVNRRSVLVGHSGVGKSSILNSLFPDLRIITAEVSDSTNKGRHTTTASTLFRLDGGTEVIDTPGVRAFGLWKISAEELRSFFPEFAEAQGTCKFADCSHSHEPFCGVRAAVDEGRIAAARHDTYLRILQSLGG